MHKILILVALFLSGSVFANDFLYRCEYKTCSYTDGCESHFNYIQLSGKTVSYWLDFKNDGTLSNINSVKPEMISTGTITKQLPNGNFLATGDNLLSAYDHKVYVKPYGWLFREVEIYNSLTSGAQYGRFIETTHVHDKRFSDPKKESKPLIQENKCVRVK